MGQLFEINSLGSFLMTSTHFLGKWPGSTSERVPVSHLSVVFYFGDMLEGAIC